jgi:hypothetical protein
MVVCVQDSLSSHRPNLKEEKTKEKTAKGVKEKRTEVFIHFIHPTGQKWNFYLI